jgi:hypothetical protein
MRDPLPPDLSRLGDEIVASVARDIRAGRRRAALLERATVTAAAALILAAGVPSWVGPAVHTGPEPLVVASLDSTGAEAVRRRGCGHLRSATTGAATTHGAERSAAVWLRCAVRPTGRHGAWHSVSSRTRRPRTSSLAGSRPTSAPTASATTSARRARAGGKRRWTPSCSSPRPASASTSSRAMALLLRLGGVPALVASQCGNASLRASLLR